MIMGATYLAYSAYFLSADFQGVKQFMNFVMGVLYLGLLVGSTRHMIKVTKILDHAIALPDNEAYAESLKLKRYMYRKYSLLLFVYFMLKVLCYTIVYPVSDEVVEVQFLAFMELTDVLIVAAMLWFMRVRTWPQFFTLSL